MVSRPLLALIALIFTAGACLLIFLVLLAGAVDGGPVDGIYFLRAATDNIPGAPGFSQWTFWNRCDGADGKNLNCGKVAAAYPFDPPRNFGTEDGIPEPFIGTNRYFLLSRFSFAFTIIALFFAVITLILGVGATCFRIGGGISGVIVSFALFWQLAAASVMTACFVLGRDAFRADGREASLGQQAFGFMWAAAACLFIAMVHCFAILGTGRGDRTRTRSARVGLFGRKRSTRTRGSFIDHERGLKDDETTSFERSR
ncbi:MAG: hypothetical protein M1832_004579 [Thelocarpon impressellum]|nr:MAG: hypothetical protein M1832_004579 [Thelocarpon impressellum]